MATGIPGTAARADDGIALKTTDANGNAMPLVIVSRSNKSVLGGYSYTGDYYADKDDVWWNIVHWAIPHAPNEVGVAMPDTTNPCAQAVVKAKPSCGTTAWDQTCVNAAKRLCKKKSTKPYVAAAYGEPICGFDKKGKPIEAIFIAGEWDGNSGTQGAGAKIVGGDPDAVSIGCRKVGAIAKCVDFGYKPWVSPEMDEMHQACVRMVRGDFCGDGTPWTVDGNIIDISDVHNIQRSESTNWVFEAMWTKHGASFMNPALDFRVGDWGAHVVNPHIGMTFAEYKKTHPYCQPKLVTQLEPSTRLGVYGLADMAFNNTDRALRTKRPAKCPKRGGGTCKQGL